MGATTIVTASWARDYQQPRATLLGSDRGVSLLVTAGPARVLIVSGTDADELLSALDKARHPVLDRIDILIVSGNAAAAEVAERAIELTSPREVMTVGSAASLAETSTVPVEIIENTTQIELPESVTVLVEVWPAANGENEDVTWSALVERAGASVYWVSDREDLMQESMLEAADVVVIGRGAPTDTTPFPRTDTIVVAGESISGPELRALALDSLGPEVTTKRIYAGEEVRIDLDPAGIDSVPGADPVGSPIAN